MDDALTVARPSDINRISARNLRPQHTGRIVYIDGRAGRLSDYRKGWLRTTLYVDGRIVKVPNSRTIVA